MGCRTYFSYGAIMCGANKFVFSGGLYYLRARKDGRVVDCGGLENR